MVQPPFFPFSSLSPFVCAPPHLCHLPTPSDLVRLPSATSAPTPRCTCGHSIVAQVHLGVGAEVAEGMRTRSDGVGRGQRWGGAQTKGEREEKGKKGGRTMTMQT